MKKNLNCFKAFFIAVFLLLLVAGTKVEAAKVGHITVNPDGSMTSDALTAPHAIKLLKDEVIEGYTLKANNIYYFGTNGNELPANLALNPIPFFTGISANAQSSKALTAGKATVSGTTITSNIGLKSGSLSGKVYYNGDLYNGYSLSGNKYYTMTNGVQGGLKTGVATGTFFNGSSFGSLGNGIYVSAGVKTTAVANLRLYKNGNYDGTTTDWLKLGNKVYYFKNGLAVTGWHHLPSYGRGIKNYTYLFDANGVLNTNLVDYYGYKKFIAKKLFIVVNKRTHNTTFYIQDQNGNPTIPALTISCATAKKKGDTPNGTFRLEKTWNKRWYVYTKTNGGPFRYYQWAVKIHGTSSLFHSSTYRRKSAASLDVGRYNKLGTSCTTHCVRHQAKYAKLIYDIATYKLSVRKWRKTRVPVRIITSPNEGPFGHVNHPARVKSSTKYDPTDPVKKK